MKATRGRHKQSRDVLLALGYYDHRFHMGAVRYACEHGWHLVADMAYKRSLPEGWRGDGIIAKAAGNGELSRFIVRTGLPVVNIGRGFRGSVPLVLVDDFALVHMAAEHFLSRGLRHFAWCAAEPVEWRQAWESRGILPRGDLFVLELAKQGHSCEVLDWERSRGRRRDTWEARRAWLAARLRALPQPIGILCEDDPTAADVVHACGDIGLAVPEAVAVLGVNNDPLVCEATRVPISSIDADMEGRAYRAAELLERLMSGHTIDQMTWMPPKCVVTRRSTDVLAIEHAGVAKALRFVNEHYAETIAVPDIARAAGMSTRGLHRAFVLQLKRAPSQEVQRVRLERAKARLRETDEKIETIAFDTGHHSAKSLFRAFRRQEGQTPTAYRSQYR
jgi:LacI family transcriptional regulator